MFQVKVREATSNDPWGPSSTQMSEIADLTYNMVAFSEIMQMIWKRLNDHGKNWRHVYKSLLLLEHRPYPPTTSSAHAHGAQTRGPSSALRAPLTSLRPCCAVLALPDGFARCDGSALLQLLLVEMGMRACLVAEEARPSLASPSGL